MFSNKIILLILLFFLPLSSQAWADDADAQLLIARAHYWEKLGRGDMAAPAWRALLLLEPDNADALAAIVRKNSDQPTMTKQDAAPAVINNQVASESVATPEPVVSEAVATPAPVAIPEPVVVPEAVATPAPVAIPEPVVVPEAVAVHAPVAIPEPVVIPEAVAVHAPVAIPEPVVIPSLASVQTEARVKQVEDWADLYVSGVKSAVQPPQEKSAQAVTNLPTGASEQAATVEMSQAAAIAENEPAMSVTIPARTEPEQALPIRSVRQSPAPEDKAMGVNQTTAQENNLIGKKQTPVVISDDAELAEKWRYKPEQTEHGIESATILKSTGAAGGTLQIDRQPSNAELTEKADYWENHGRADIAASLRKQAGGFTTSVAQVKPVAVVNAPLVTAVPEIPFGQAKRVESGRVPQVAAGSSNKWQAAPAAVAGTVVTVPLTSEPAESADRAAYWESHGRADIAAGLRKQASGSVATRNPVNSNAEGQPIHAVAEASDTKWQAVQPVANTLAVTSTQVEPADRAAYWESHGRSDLAAQLRQQLQGEEKYRRTPQADKQGMLASDSQTVGNARGEARSALENYLLKHPENSGSRLELAKIYMGAGENARARVQIDNVLLGYPDLPEGLFVSASLYASQRLWRETLQTLEKIAPVSRTTEMGHLQKTAWAHVQIDRADALIRQGHNVEAEVLLRQVAAELAVNYNQQVEPEPPPLWGSNATSRRRAR